MKRFRKLKRRFLRFVEKKKRRFLRFVSRVYDIPNAFRVVDIMYDAGVDIEKVQDWNRGYHITTKWYVTKEQAEDLQKIILFQEQYKKRSPLWNKIFFRGYREGTRPLVSWF